MIGFKIAGAVIFVICGVVASIGLNKKADVALDGVDCMIGVIRYIKNMVDMYSLPFPKILERMIHDSRCRRLLTGCGYRDRELPRDINEMKDFSFVGDTEVKGLFCQFLSEFGVGYREEQIKLCEHYELLLSERRERIAAELPIKKKRNMALCVTGTLIPVILLI